MDKVVEVKGVKLLAAKVDGVDMNGLYGFLCKFTDIHRLTLLLYEKYLSHRRNMLFSLFCM